MPSPAPIVEKIKKTNIIQSPKTPVASSGYVSQPPIKIASPVLPSENGYVTHSMFNVSSSQRLFFWNLSTFVSTANAIKRLHTS